MSTEHSPESILREQAHHIAVTLKRAEQGENVAPDPMHRIGKSLELGVVKLAIVMDDKLIALAIPWEQVRALTLPLLCDFIYGLMRGAREKAH